MSTRTWVGSVIVALISSHGVAVVDAREVQPLAPSSNPLTAFTFQGQLRHHGVPVNATCDFQLARFDVANGGTARATIQPGAIVVANGLLTASPERGLDASKGLARWLETGVRGPTGAGSLALLSPRPALTPAPIILSLPELYPQQDATSPDLVGEPISNTVASGVSGATVSVGGMGGSAKQDSDDYGTVGGGRSSTPTGDSAHVGGGGANTASAPFATVPGGLPSSANGSHILVAGHRAIANADGGFTSADGNSFDFTSTTANSFRVRSTGGVRLVTGIDGSGATTGVARSSTEAVAAATATRRRSCHGERSRDARRPGPGSDLAVERQWDRREHQAPRAHGPGSLRGVRPWRRRQVHQHDWPGRRRVELDSGANAMAQDQEALIAALRKQIDALESRPAVLEALAQEKRGDSTDVVCPVGGELLGAVPSHPQ